MTQHRIELHRAGALAQARCCDGDYSSVWLNPTDARTRGEQHVKAATKRDRKRLRQLAPDRC